MKSYTNPLKAPGFHVDLKMRVFSVASLDLLVLLEEKLIICLLTAINARQFFLLSFLFHAQRKIFVKLNCIVYLFGPNR